MPYITVFDITQKPFEWWWPSFGLIFVVVGIFLIKFGPKLDRNKSLTRPGFSLAVDSRFIGWFFVIFASGWTLFAFGGTYSTYRDSVQAYRTGQYSMVEGFVEGFHPMPYEGHQDECFRVKKEKFCYSDYAVSPAFNQSASHGGPIRAGLPVRIAYYEDDNFQAYILRLEIRADSLPSGAERTYSKNEEAKWHLWANSNPLLDRFQLGFSFAAFLISLCWNLDWKHYIRYWIRSGPPYTRLAELGFRAFFFACLVGSTINVVRMVSEKHRTATDFEEGALCGLILIGIIGAYDLVVRWRTRGKNESSGEPTHQPS